MCQKSRQQKGAVHRFLLLIVCCCRWRVKSAG